MSLVDTHADRIVWEEDGSAVFTLRMSLKTASGDVATLTVRRPMLEDLLTNEKATGDDLLKTVYIVARLTGLKLADLDKIDGGDAMVLADIMARMLEYGEDRSFLDRHDDRLTITEHDASLTLRKSVHTPKGEIDEIVLRRPTLGETRANNGTTLSASVKLVAILTGFGPNVLGRLDAVDGLILGELIADFLGKSRRSRTGAL